jgi:hypothetical protein
MGFFIYGMPNETAETMDKTTQLALELDPDLARPFLDQGVHQVGDADGADEQGQRSDHAQEDLDALENENASR